MRRALLFAALLLAGCAGPHPAPVDHIPDGRNVAPPPGAVQFCKEHPEHELCR